jgi:hypothetical protein
MNQCCGFFVNVLKVTDENMQDPGIYPDPDQLVRGMNPRIRTKNFMDHP